MSPGPRAVASSASRTSRMTSRPDPWRRAVDVLLAQSIARVASAHPSAPLPQGKRRASSSADDDIIDRLRASAQLCKQMSAAHVARVIGTTERRVVQAPTAAARLLLFHFVCWSAGYIRSSLADWRRLRNFAGSRETVDGFTIARFLRRCARRGGVATYWKCCTKLWYAVATSQVWENVRRAKPLPGVAKVEQVPPCEDTAA